MARKRRRKIAVGGTYNIEVLDRKNTYASGRERRLLTMICIEMQKSSSDTDLRPFLRELMTQKIITSWRGNEGVAYRSMSSTGEWIEMKRYWAYCKYRKRKKAKTVISAAVRMMV